MKRALAALAALLVLSASTVAEAQQVNIAGPALICGTWTPTLGDGTNNYTLSFAVGTYCKYGTMVIASADIIWTSKGSAGASQLVASLPVQTNSLSASRYSAALGFLSGFATSSGTKQITASATESSTALAFVQTNDGAAPTSLAANAQAAAGAVQFSIAYQST